MLSRREMLAAAGLLAPGAAAAAEDEVRFPFRVTRNIPWTVVHLNGKEPGLPFALDTSARTFRIVDAKAQELALPRQGKVLGRGVLGTGDVIAYEADLLVGGAVRFDDTALYGLRQMGANLQGSIPLTDAYVMGFDFDAQQVLVSRRMPQELEGYQPLRLDPREDYGRPLIHAEFEGERVSLVIDTGYSGGVYLSPDYVKARGLWDRYPKWRSGTIRARSGQGETRLVRGERLKLDRFVFANPFVLMVEPKAAETNGVDIADGVIGMDLIRRLNFINDPRRRQIWIKPNKALADGYRVDRAGARVELVEGEGQVAFLHPGGPADRAGLRQGDKITGWRGRDGIEGLTWAMLGAPGSKVEIQVERDGKSQMIGVVLEEPF